MNRATGAAIEREEGALLRVAVVGAGAMGCVYGGLLAEAGHDVWLVDRWSAHVSTIKTRGLEIRDWAGLRTVRVRATEDPLEAGTADLVFIFAKSYETAGAAVLAEPLVGPQTMLLTLQNGIGNAERLAERFDPGHILYGVSYHGAELLGPGTVRHSGSGDTIFGPFHPGETGPHRPRERRLEPAWLADAFGRAGIPARAENDVRPTVWGKLLLNVGVNATCALSALTCGELVADAAAWSVVGRLVDEVQRVARAEGIAIPFPDPMARVSQAMHNLAGAKASMLQDVERRRPTEIDALNGEVVRVAARHGIEVPANDLITLLVKAREAGYAHAEA